MVGSGGEGTVRLARTPRILAGASLEKGVTSPTRRIPKACSRRLIVFAGGCATSDKEGLPKILTLPLRMSKMVAIGLGLGLLLVRFFHTMKTITMNGGIRVRHTKVWEMKLWVGPLTRSPNHRLHTESKRENFPGDLLSQPSLYTMKGQTLWSM